MNRDAIMGFRTNKRPERTAHPTGDMRRESLSLLSFAAVMTLNILISGCCVSPRDDFANVDNDIRLNLPAGSSKETVEAYLDKKQIAHSYVKDMRETPFYKHTEIAVIRGKSNGAVRTDIQVLFMFDDNDSKLLRYSLKKAFTGS